MSTTRGVALGAVRAGQHRSELRQRDLLAFPLDGKRIAVVVFAEKLPADLDFVLILRAVLAVSVLRAEID